MHVMEDIDEDIEDVFCYHLFLTSHLHYFVFFGTFHTLDGDTGCLARAFRLDARSGHCAR